MAKRELTPAELAAAATLAKAIRASDQSQEAIGASIGVSQGMIWQWANGRLPVPVNRAVQLAEALQVDPSEISVAYAAFARGAEPWLAKKLGESGRTGDSPAVPPDSNVRPAGKLRGRVPVISAVQAGHFTDAVDNYAPGDADEWIDVGVPVKRHTFALVVEGDSMEPEFTEGMRVVVEPDMTPEIGDYVVAGNGEQATLKKLVRDGNDLYLKPLNPRYPIKPLGDARIIGVVREAHRKYR